MNGLYRVGGKMRRTLGFALMVAFLSLGVISGCGSSNNDSYDFAGSGQPDGSDGSDGSDGGGFGGTDDVLPSCLPPPDGWVTPSIPGDEVVDKINKQFYSPASSWAGANGDLSVAGVALHGWDESEFLPQPWIQQAEPEGHSPNTSSGGILNNLGRIPNAFENPAQDKNGFISIFSIGFSNYPALGGVIYNTAAFKSGTNVPVVSVKCAGVGDIGDDNNTGDGCGCPRSAIDVCTIDGQLYNDTLPKADLCRNPYGQRGEWATCANNCNRCDFTCSPLNSPAWSSDITCAIKPNIEGSFDVERLMIPTIANCRTSCSAEGKDPASCYNEVLFNSAKWAPPVNIPTMTPPCSKYTHATDERCAANTGFINPDLFPATIWAFSYTKSYRTTGSWMPLDWTEATGDSCTTNAAGCNWQGYTTRAWYNFNVMYPDQKTPLLELDVLASATTPPFTVVCSAITDTSAACKDALKLANIDLDKPEPIYCGPGLGAGRIEINPADSKGLRATCTSDG